MPRNDKARLGGESLIFVASATAARSLATAGVRKAASATAPHTLSVDDHHAAPGLCDPVVLIASGCFDRGAVPVLASAVRAALTRRPPLVVLTLSRVERVHQPSLTAGLLTAAHTIALCDGCLRTVATPGQPAFHAIHDAGIAGRVALHRSIDTALDRPW